MQRTIGHEFGGKMIVQSLNIHIWGYRNKIKPEIAHWKDGGEKKNMAW
jgi:hypothetical protein